MLTKIKRMLLGASPEEIHQAFEEAADSALIEAREIIRRAQPTDKEERLRRLGMRYAADEEKRASIERAMKSRSSYQVLEHIEDLNQAAPGYRFITNNQIGDICKKYRLIYAPLSRYKSFVPEKNLKDLENFTDNYRRNIMKIEAPGLAAWRWDDFDQFPLMICAGRSMLNLHGFDVEKGWIAVYDPVVIQKVKYGGLNITAWGKESEDPLIVD